MTIVRFRKIISRKRKFRVKPAGIWN